jgi:hypothetical protein
MLLGARRPLSLPDFNAVSERFPISLLEARQTDRSLAGISRAGDVEVRAALFTAANSMMTRSIR